MSAKRFTVGQVRSILAYLRLTDANLAFNNHSFTKDKDHYSVRGFLGVRSSQSEFIEGAFCFGSDESLFTICFEIRCMSRKTVILLTDAPKNVSEHEGNKIVLSLVKSLKEKFHERMVQRNLKLNNKNGNYTGPRLEAHKRSSTLPKNKFENFPKLFSKSFANLAKDLHITYK